MPGGKPHEQAGAQAGIGLSRLEGGTRRREQKPGLKMNLSAARHKENHMTMSLDERPMPSMTDRWNFACGRPFT